jgi:hypothetical protein
MRDIILLLCRNVDLRRLYHELLERENALVHDVEKIEDLLAMGSVHEYTKMALYIDDQPIEEVTLFLFIQKRIRKFSKIRLFLLTSETYLYRGFISVSDVLCDTLLQDPIQIANCILEVNK